MQCVCENIHFVHNIYVYVNIYFIFNRVHKHESPKSIPPQEATVRVTKIYSEAVSLSTVSDHRRFKVLLIKTLRQ
jgi:hypothetical protein